MTDHRHWSRTLVSCAVGSILLTGWAFAQQPGPSYKAERPEPAVMQVKPPDPKLEALLKAWERNTAGIKMLQGEHFRREYNDVFQVEKCSEGIFYFEAPDKGRIDMRGVAPKEGEVSRKKDPKTGQAYRKEAGMDQMWICNGQQIVVVDPPQKQFERMPIPPEMQGDNIVRSPLPFLFGLKAAEAKQRFQLTLAQESEAAAVIDVVPRSKADAQNYREARIYLDKETYVPYAVRLIDPAGSGSTEYLFYREKLKINQPGIKQVLFRQDPFNPNLGSYKEVQAPNSGVQPAFNQAPAGSKSASARPGFLDGPRTSTPNRR